MDINNITYGEVLKFFDGEFNKVDVYIAYKNSQEEKEEVRDIIKEFPKNNGQLYDFNWVDKEKSIGIVTCIKDGKPIAHIPYLNLDGQKGLTTRTHNTYDKAVIECLCYKYLKQSNVSNSPSEWIFKMLEMEQ